MDKPLSKPRIYAIDIMRGISIAGMALVNHPGNWKYVYAPLRHAEWNGLTPTDLIFPFFLFIMGISTYISLSKTQFRCDTRVVMKILRRTAVIFAIGLFLNWFGTFCPLSRLRLPGVMQRLALCYAACALIALSVSHKRIPWLIAALLCAYLGCLLGGRGFEPDETNIIGIIDRSILTSSHLSIDHGIDVMALLSTVPAVAQVLIGFCVGRMMLAPRNDALEDAKQRLQSFLLRLMLIGATLALAGWLLSYGCPVNKKVWSPSYVLLSSGIAACTLGLLIYVIDVKGRKAWCGFFEVFGINPLFMYILGSMLGKIFQMITISYANETLTLRKFVDTVCLTPLFGSYGASLVYALLFVVINWAVGLPLYKRRIYIKI
jgi:predicted acyltransferase